LVANVCWREVGEVVERVAVKVRTACEPRHPLRRIASYMDRRDQWSEAYMDGILYRSFSLVDASEKVVMIARGEKWAKYSPGVAMLFEGRGQMLMTSR
jgi:hypothetical protein